MSFEDASEKRVVERGDTRAERVFRHFVKLSTKIFHAIEIFGEKEDGPFTTLAIELQQSNGVMFAQQFVEGKSASGSGWIDPDRASAGILAGWIMGKGFQIHPPRAMQDCSIQDFDTGKILQVSTSQRGVFAACFKTKDFSTAPGVTGRGETADVPAYIQDCVFGGKAVRQLVFVGQGNASEDVFVERSFSKEKTVFCLKFAPASDRSLPVLAQVC